MVFPLHKRERSCVDTHMTAILCCFQKKNTKKQRKPTTLNHHPDLQQHPRLCLVHIDFAVWLEDRNKMF